MRRPPDGSYAHHAGEVWAVTRGGRHGVPGREERPSSPVPRSARRQAWPFLGAVAHMPRTPGTRCRHALARHSAAATRRAPAPLVPPPPAWSTGERGVLTALPGRTPRSYGKNRVSGTISCEFPGRAGRAGIARRLRRALPQTCSPPAARPSARKASGWNPSPPCTGPSNAHRGLDNQPAARAEVGIVGTLRSTGARVPRAPSTGSSCDGEATQTMTYDSDRALAS